MKGRENGTQYQGTAYLEPEAVPRDHLIAPLRRLGIRHLATTTPSLEDVPPSPLSLVTSLATCPDARVRSALIPLFLWRPDYAPAARDASGVVSGEARVYLQCSYSAALVLQHLLADTLARITRPEAPPLPDLFADDLGLTAYESPPLRLEEIARRHAELSGADINWRGTYEHAVAAALRFAVPEIAWSR